MATETEVTMHIDAPPERVYALISDVSRMGEWSPECVKCTWEGDANGPAVGARFRGSNRQGWVRWSTTAEIVAAEPGCLFAFTTRSGKREATRWRYVLSSAGGGTDVTESYEAVYEPPLVKFAERLFMPHRARQLEDGMRATLERIKAAAEQVSEAT